LRLYGFYPEGHGPLSFFVADTSLQQAKEKVEAYIAKHKPYGSRDWPGEYEVAEVDVGVVLINNND